MEQACLVKAGHGEGKAAGRAAGPRGVRSSPGASVCGGGSRCPGGNRLDELVWARRTVEGRPWKRGGWPEQRVGASCWAHPASQSCEESTRPPFDGWENQGSQGHELPRSTPPVSQDLGVKPGFSDHRRMNARQRGITSKAPSTGEPRTAFRPRQPVLRARAGAAVDLGEDEKFSGRCLGHPRALGLLSSRVDGDFSGQLGAGGDEEQQVCKRGAAGITPAPPLPFCPWHPAGLPAPSCPAPAPTANTDTGPTLTRSSHSPPLLPAKTSARPGFFVPSTITCRQTSKQIKTEKWIAGQVHRTRVTLHVPLRQ